MQPGYLIKMKAVPMMRSYSNCQMWIYISQGSLLDSIPFQKNYWFWKYYGWQMQSFPSPFRKRQYNAKEKRSLGPLCWGQHHHPPNRAQHQTIRESEPVVWGQIFVHRPIIWSRRPERVWRAGSPRQQPPTDEPSVAVRPASSEQLPVCFRHQTISVRASRLFFS